MAARIQANGLTLKQETFCHEYIRNSGIGSRAYKAAYDTETDNEAVARQEAYLLLKNPLILAKIEDLKKQYGHKLEIRVETMTETLWQDRDFAREMEAPAPALGATIAICKLNGLLSDKMDITSNGATIAPQNITDLEAAKVLLFLASRQQTIEHHTATE